MRSFDAVLESRPKSFQGVRVMNAAYPFVNVMIDRTMLESVPSDASVLAGRIGRDGCSFWHSALQDREQSRLLRVRNNLGIDMTVAFNDPKHRGFVFEVTALPHLAASFSLHGRPDIGFVGLDVTRHTVVAVNDTHVLADLVAHAPRGLVRHSKLALQFFRGDTVAGCGEQVHGVKPFLKWSMRACKGRTRHWVNMMATPRASIGWNLADAGPVAFLAAFRALKSVAVANGHQMLKAGVVIRESLEELSDSKRLIFHAS